MALTRVIMTKPRGGLRAVEWLGVVEWGPFRILMVCLLLEGSCLLLDRQARPPRRPELRSCESMWVCGFVVLCSCASVYVYTTYVQPHVDNQLML